MVSGTIIYMRKSWIFIGSLTLIIIVAMLYVILSSGRVSSPQDSSRTSRDSSSAAETQPVLSPTDAPTAQPGIYTDYNEQSFAHATGRRILFFHAPWCPQCRQLEQSIEEGNIPSNVTIFKTDYDSHTSLRQRYGVTLQTTLVEVDASGNAVGTYVAYDTATLAAVLKGLKL